MSQSNTRYFNTFFYEDPYVESLSTEETFIFQTLILNPHNNVAGLYEISIRRLAQYTKLSEDKVTSAIMKLQNDGKISFSNNWMALKNFFKNNNLVPTMTYKSFQILKEAPKDKVQFVFSDKDGNPEKWVGKYIIDLEKGINQVMMSKHRAAIKNAEKNDLSIPAKPREVKYTLENFNQDVFRTLPPSLPPTLPSSLTLDNGEYKQELEHEINVNMKLNEIEKERECSTLPEFTPPPPYTQDPKDKLKIFLNCWNKNVPKQSTSSIANMNPDLEIMNFVIQCDFEEYKTCVLHYAEAYPFNKSRIGGFLKSLKPSFISNWFSEDSVENRKQLSEPWGNKKPVPDFVEDNRKF